MRCIFLATVLWMAGPAFAQDTQLDALHKTLEGLRSHEASGTTPAPGPELTVAKHQLRDWIESQLGSLKDVGEAQVLAANINAALKAVAFQDVGDYPKQLGSLGDVTLNSDSGVLIITTAFGIVCQDDVSAYGYKRIGGRWQRVWESEQHDHSPEKYAPQKIAAVHVWQSFRDGHEDGPLFVLTLGNDWGCSSAWHPVYYRVWRVDSSGSKLLIDGSEMAWRRVGTYAVGSISQDWPERNTPVDVLIEYTKGSVDTTVHNREAIRHFLIDGDQVRRVDPIALSPRDFVDEWLTRGWNESAAWSASPILRQWHQRLHADWVGGDFGYPTRHCQTPDLWQVTFQPSNAQKNFEREPAVHFLVRWRPPYHFTMVDIRDKPWPLCTEEDSQADEWRTLFSTQEWRQ